MTSDADGLFSEIVRQLLATVLQLEDEDSLHDIGLKELKGKHCQPQSLDLVTVFSTQQHISWWLLTWKSWGIYE